MRHRGFVHIFSVLVIVAILAGGLLLLSVKKESDQKKAVGSVLSSSDNSEDEDSSSSGSKQSEQEKKQLEAQKEFSKKESEQNKESRSQSSSKTKTESQFGSSKAKIETENGRSEIEIESSDGAKFKSKVEDDGKFETKVRSGNLRIEIKVEGGKVVTRVKNENDEEVEVEDEERDELLEDVEDELEDDDIKIASDSAGLGFVQKGHRVRTNFPLSVNPTTGELFVSTPAGDRVVAILPDVAIQNMIAAGIMSRVETPPSPPAVEPPGGTDSATPQATVAPTVAGASIELSEFKGKVAYRIDGVRDEKFAGIIPVNIKVKAVVSVENGELLDINQGLFTKLLDLLSF